MVGLYIDKSDRLCATMNLFNVLRTDSPYKVNDIVKGTVFSLKRGLGAMVAVDGKYLGLIHEGEILKPLHSGEEVEVRVSNVKEDGKLDLSLKDAPRLQIDKDGEKILKVLIRSNGALPLNDDSSPEEITKTLGMSKSSFKKATGRLMKRNVVIMTKSGIKMLANDGKDVKPTVNRNVNNRNNTNNKNNSTRNTNNRNTNNRNSDSRNTNNKNTNKRNTNNKNTNSRNTKDKTK